MAKLAASEAATAVSHQVSRNLSISHTVKPVLSSRSQTHQKMVFNTNYV